MLRIRPFLQNGDLGFKIRRLDIGDQSPLEARPQPLLDRGNLLRQAVGRDHDLPLQFVQRVKGVEELLLRALLAGDELDVVHQQHVHRAKPFAETQHAIEAQRVDHFVREFLRADVRQAHRRVALLDQVAHRLHQVRLPHPHAAIQEKRVVRARWIFRHGQRRRVRKLV